MKRTLTEEFPDATVEESNDGFNVCCNAQILIEVRWLNKVGERQESYDLKLIRNGNEEFIEVKSTKREDKDWFEISKPQWDLAKQSGHKFYLYRVYGAGTKTAKLVVIQDPYEHWQKGLLIANPIRICI